jgi:hypothetical protein
MPAAPPTSSAAAATRPAVRVRALRAWSSRAPVTSRSTRRAASALRTWTRNGPTSTSRRQAPSPVETSVAPETSPR